MAHMTWDQSLDTGIDIIDEQHKGIVGYINQLDDAAITNDRDQVSAVLQGLIGYTVSHFAFEEDLLDQHNYDLITAHKKVHEAFVNRIKKYHAAHLAGKNIARSLSGELQVWLTGHIKNEDADYVKKLKIKSPTGSILSNMMKKFFS